MEEPGVATVTLRCGGGGGGGGRRMLLRMAGRTLIYSSLLSTASSGSSVRLPVALLVRVLC